MKKKKKKKKDWIKALVLHENAQTWVKHWRPKSVMWHQITKQETLFRGRHDNDVQKREQLMKTASRSTSISNQCGGRAGTIRRDSKPLIWKCRMPNSAIATCCEYHYGQPWQFAHKAFTVNICDWLIAATLYSFTTRVSDLIWVCVWVCW